MTIYDVKTDITPTEFVLEMEQMEDGGNGELASRFLLGLLAVQYH